MRTTIEDLRTTLEHVRFPLVDDGYDARSVDEFIDELLRLVAALEPPAVAVVGADDELVATAADEAAMAVLDDAAAEAERVRTDARTDAERIRREAQRSADAVVVDARVRATEILIAATRKRDVLATSFDARGPREAPVADGGASTATVAFDAVAAVVDLVRGSAVLEGASALIGAPSTSHLDAAAGASA